MGIFYQTKYKTKNKRIKKVMGMEMSPGNIESRKIAQKRKDRTNRNFTNNNWTQVIYDIRDLILPKERRGNAAVDKAIMFQIAAAGIPNSDNPESGYRQSVKILSIKLNMDQKTLEKRLEFLESNNLIISESQGPFRPRLRYVNNLEIQRVLKLQLKDLETWELKQLDKPESAKREYFMPVKYHLRGSDPWGNLLTPDIDTQLDTPIDAPIGAQVDKTLDINTKNSTSKIDLRDYQLSNCPALHAWDLECEECFPARINPPEID